ncbi:MAG: hypothetical protein ABJN39_09455 [Sulfitobacter sp.]|uniref:hypothetical protein n=1 Tax=Alphaproteobacteria TaxID=28211 RepID=UPI002942F5A6|nr:hypothetical protein [Sulfitobacter sp. LC.270.F.C4]WOI13530.1 hypothetical protein R1T45_01855 [Sulfitobacter sp. LC.270.F.C4]
MQHYTFDTNDPAAFCAITEAGLRAFDRYHRNLEARTVTLSPADWHRVDDDTPKGGAQEAAQ